MEQAIQEFLADLQLAGRADWTIKKHRQELARLQRWVSAQTLDWQKLTTPQLRQYARLKADRGHSARSNMFCSLRTFFRWAVESGYVSLSPAACFKTPKKPEPLPRALSLEQVKRVIAFLQARESRGTRRDEALILTGLYAGLRACELANLRWSAVDLAGLVINIRLSKMGKGRSVPMHSALADVLSAWRELQALDDNAPVFSLDGKPLRPARPGKIVARISAKCGVQFTTHMLRHTFATWTLRKSGNLYAVSKSLGHSQVRQTEIYVSAAVEDLREAVEQLPDIHDW
ncbi:tyrosine-type recombinase/integrase [Kouleothrix sp.]|uniref:tyrosine-type recombinase/integrase n=1 Tax=Kouleothrix sp. TaxID=2779161 RepID=UPI003919B871